MLTDIARYSLVLSYAIPWGASYACQCDMQVQAHIYKDQLSSGSLPKQHRASISAVKGAMLMV